MYSINDGFVLQTYKTLGALYPKVQLNNFEIGKIQVRSLKYIRFISHN
jgi:hypothetical protein